MGNFIYPYFILRNVEQILKKFDNNIPHWKPFQSLPYNLIPDTLAYLFLLITGQLQ
jgi:hypothetical protein